LFRWAIAPVAVLALVAGGLAVGLPTPVGATLLSPNTCVATPSGAWEGTWTSTQQPGISGSWSALFTFSSTVAPDTASGTVTASAAVMNMPISGSVSCGGAYTLTGTSGTTSVNVTVALSPNGTSLTGQYTLLSGGSVFDSGTWSGSALPTVTRVSPASGTVAGGTNVIITGTGLRDVYSVLFGSVAATSFQVVSATQVRAVAPPQAAGVVDVRVVAPIDKSAVVAADQFTYVPVAVTHVTPASGTVAGGTTVTITGTSLAGATAVTFGGVAATSFTPVSSTRITAVSPPNPGGTVDIQVTAPGGTSSFVSADQFTYVTVAVTHINIKSGPVTGGTAVTITGTSLAGATAVTFGSVAAAGLHVNSNTSITALSPPGTAGPVDIEVTAPGGTSPPVPADVFSYAAPAVTRVSPNRGGTGGGTTVTITGTSLLGATGVTFGTVAAANFTVVSSTSITAVSPPGAAGIVDVEVTVPSGTTPATTGDHFTYALPAVTSLSPNNGAAVGGITVAITGTNLSGATQVLFGTVPAQTFYVNSPTSITAVSPELPIGTTHVTVVTANGASKVTTATTYTAT
jgi:hypothetical protein